MTVGAEWAVATILNATSRVPSLMPFADKEGERRRVLGAVSKRRCNFFLQKAYCHGSEGLTGTGFHQDAGPHEECTFGNAPALVPAATRDLVARELALLGALMDPTTYARPMLPSAKAAAWEASAATNHMSPACPRGPVPVTWPPWPTAACLRSMAPRMAT